MKRTIILRSVAVVLAGMLVLGILVLRAPKVQAKHGCSEGTLQGDYLINMRGYRTPTVLVGVTTFDGEGHTSLDYTISLGGVISRRVHQEGVYTLGPDCTGTMLNGGVRNWDIFFTQDGSEGAAIRTDDGVVSIQTLKKR